MTNSMTKTTITGSTVPDAHLLTTIPCAFGTFYLYGYPGHDLTARFDLACDIEAPASFGKNTVRPILHNADWPTAWAALCERIEPDRVETVLRSVTAPIVYAR